MADTILSYHQLDDEDYIFLIYVCKNIRLWLYFDTRYIPIWWLVNYRSNLLEFFMKAYHLSSHKNKITNKQLKKYFLSYWLIKIYCSLRIYSNVQQRLHLEIIKFKIILQNEVWTGWKFNRLSILFCYLKSKLRHLHRATNNILLN